MKNFFLASAISLSLIAISPSTFAASTNVKVKANVKGSCSFADGNDVIIDMGTLTAQLGMPVTNQNHQVIFSNLGHFATNVNFHHVRIPVNLTTIMETPKMAIQKIKAQNKNVYTMTIAELKNTMGFNKSDSLSQVIAQQAFNTAEDIATIAYSELDILQRQLISSTITLPSATSGRQERQLGLIFGMFFQNQNVSYELTFEFGKTEV